LDYKLTPKSNGNAQAFGRHSADHGVSDLAQLARRLPRRLRQTFEPFLVTEAPANADLASAKRWKNFRGNGERFSSRVTSGHGMHCLLLWDGRPPQGLHDDARKLS